MLTEILSFFINRHIPVEFRSDAAHPIDASLFDSINYSSIVRNGYFVCSPAELLLAASVHFQGRYRNSFASRCRNAYDEVIPSLIWDTTKGSPLRLNSTESSEFQIKSTEVISIGMGLSLCHKLFAVQYKDISTIETTGKRCDFSFIKQNLEYAIETRGRKREDKINPAIADVYTKKLNYNQAKFGFVSHLPRSGESSSIIVVDPVYKPIIADEREQISRILRYYSRVARASGLWRLSFLLNERLALFDDIRSFSSLDGVPLDFGNILKMGQGYEIRLRGRSSNFFRSRIVSPKSLITYDDYTFVIGLDKKLLTILENQDYEALRKYRHPVRNHVSQEEPLAAYTNDSGVTLAALPTNFIK